MHDVLEHVTSIVKEAFAHARPFEDIHAVVTYFHHGATTYADAQVLMQLPAYAPEDKTNVFMTAAIPAGLLGCDFIILAMDTWYVEADKLPSGMRPSEHPDRMESLSLALIAKDGTRIMSHLPYEVRHDTVVWLEDHEVLAAETPDHVQFSWIDTLFHEAMLQGPSPFEPGSDQALSAAGALFNLATAHHGFEVHTHNDLTPKIEAALERVDG